MLPAVAALIAPLPAGIFGCQCPPRGRTVPVRFGPSWHRVFRFIPSSLLGTMASADSPLGHPNGASPGKNALLHSTTAAFTSATEPATSLCCASSSHHAGLDMRFLSIGLPISPRLPPSNRLPSRSWLWVVVVSCFHEWSSYKGLSPYLQRAHAGRTPSAAPLPRAPQTGHSEGER